MAKVRIPPREAPAPEEPGLPQAPALDVRRALRLGSIGGLTVSFVAAIGMVEQFSSRDVVEGLSLAYAMLMGIPALFGYLAGSPPKQLEGYEQVPAGSRNVVAGLVAGALTGALTALFAAVAPVGLRSIFPNISPAMVDLLTFGLGKGLGSVVLIVGGTILGGLGAALHLLSDRWRRAILWGLLWVTIFGVMESVISQLIRGSRSLGLDLLVGVFGETPDTPILIDLLYTPSGVLRLLSATVLFVGFTWLYYWRSGRPSTIMERFRKMDRPRRQRTTLLAAAVMVLVLAVLPFVLGRFLSQVLDVALIFMLMGLGLNIVLGFAGLLDLGYVAFFAVGAYTTAVLTSPISPCFEPGGWFEGLTSAPALSTFFLAIPFVIVAAAVAGIIVGTPVLRMRGDYLAIVTLAFGEIARILFLSDWLKGCFGGARGVRQTPAIVLTPVSLSVLIGIAIGFLVFLLVGRRVAARRRRAFLIAPGAALAVAAAVALVSYVVLSSVVNLNPIELNNPQYFFYAMIVVVLLAAYVSWTLQDSRIGRAWMAMREDELVAETMGVNIVSAKLWAFIVGAVLASLGGALFATKIHSIFPQSFSIVVSIQVLIIVILGGMGSIRGAMVGALVVIALPNLLREFETYRFLMYGALLIFMMLKRPEGFIPSRRRAAELHEEDRSQDMTFKQAQEEGRDEGTAPAPRGAG